jgi:hypothetical protein
MKCIKFNDDGTLDRVSDAAAERLVGSKQAVYVSKEEYKKAIRPAEQESAK